MSNTTTGISVFKDDFFGPRTYSSSSTGSTIWCSGVAVTGGTPSFANVNSTTGDVQVKLAATNEAESGYLYWKDVLGMDISAIKSITFGGKAVNFDANTTGYLGIAGAHNATATSITNAAWLKVSGASPSTAVLETYDGSTSNRDVASNITVTNSKYFLFKISLNNGLSDVRFHLSNSRGQLEKCPKSSNTVFNMSAATGGIQPYIRVDKSTGAAQAEWDIDFIEIEYARAVVNS